MMRKVTPLARSRVMIEKQFFACQVTVQRRTEILFIRYDNLFPLQYLVYFKNLEFEVTFIFGALGQLFKVSLVGDDMYGNRLRALDDALTDQVTLRLLDNTQNIGRIVTLVKARDRHQTAQYQFAVDENRLAQVTGYLLTHQDDGAMLGA